MNTLKMNKVNIFLLIVTSAIALSACSKDDPTPEIDQEEVSGAKLIFTEVKREPHGDHAHYEDIEGAESSKMTFSGAEFLPGVGEHLHLEVGKSYKMELVAIDFAGRETQQTFVARPEVHQAFIIGAPANSLSYEYADKNEAGKAVNVGVTGYITVNESSNTFVLRYIMRHLNDGVKNNIKSSDWNNVNYTKFTGANDLDLNFEIHLIDGANAH